jgi:hypothetical protein
MIRKAFVILTSLLFVLPAISFAQVNDQISVTTDPTNPGANQSVTVTLTSYSLDLQSSEIDWSLDGRKIKGGIGNDSFVFTTKSVGSPSTISVTVIPNGVPQITKTITINPMAVDILWQATDSIVPPFYKGKAMPTAESQVKFVAIPQVQTTSGSLLSSSSLIYNWKENYTSDQSNSGYGKDFFITAMDYLNPKKSVGVSISTRDGGTATDGTMEISPVAPEVLWYAASPLYGPLFSTALNETYTVTGNETSLIAMPFFFSPADPTSKVLSYAWQINGTAVDTPTIPNSLFLHRDSNSTGSATIDLSISNTTKLFQEVTTHLNLLLQ